MDYRNNCKYSLNIYLALYLVYIVFVWCCDVFCFFEYYLKFEQNNTINSLLSMIAVITFLKISTRYFTITKNNMSKIMKSIVIFMILNAFVRCILPDLSFDSSQMHFCRMIPGFFNNISGNIFSYGLGSYMWFLGDRLFYLPYLILGYRLAPILNVFVNIISYILVVEILKGFIFDFDKESNNNYNNLIELIAGIIVFSYYNSMSWSMYMVDLFAVPFLLQMLKMTIEALREKEVSNSTELYFYALISGIAFALKMTNFIFIIPMMVVYLFYRKKSISLKLFIKAFIIAILPFSIYFLYSYIETGNPVYPAYNAIFKSTYYSIQNFKDLRWGPKSLIEYITWPIATLVGPFDRLSELAPPLQCMPAIGIISGSLLLILKRKADKFNIYREIFTIYLLQTYLWVFTTGYARYFIYGEIFAGIILTICTIEILNERKFQYIKKSIVFSLILIMFIQVLIGQALISYKGHEWAWRTGIFSNNGLIQYKQNLKQILTDRGEIGNQEQTSKIDYILQINELSNINYLVSKDAPKINLVAMNTTLNMRESNPKYLNKVYRKIQKDMNSGKKFFTTDLNTNYPRIVDDCNTSGLFVKNIEILQSYFSPNKEILLIETGLLNGQDVNKIDWVDDMQQDYTVEMDDTKASVIFEGILALAPYVTWEIPDSYFKIMAEDENGNVKQVFSNKIEKMKFYKIREKLDLTGLEGKIQFKYVHVLENGEKTNWGYMSVINSKVYVEKEDAK